MAKEMRLHGLDVALAIRLLKPCSTLSELASELGSSASQIHASLVRLEIAGLVRPGTRNTNRHALKEFIEHGVRYAFPAQIGKVSRGVPTSHSAPLLADKIDATESFVWPARSSSGVTGLAVSPLYDKAPQLVESSPETYRALALVDAFRVGRARERAIALQVLVTLLYASPAVG